MSKYLMSLYLVLSVGVITAQNWHFERNDELLNPYNIHTKGMNTPFTGDFDDDGDFDLIVGCQGGVLQYYENIGTPDSAIWRMDEDYFSTAELDTFYAPQPSLVDLDGDGMDELYVSYQSYWGEPFPGIFKYSNSGSQENPSWLESEFDIGQDISPFTCPQFADYDLDGDIDIVMMWRDAPWRPSLILVKNVGDINNPVFFIESSVFHGLYFAYGEINNFRVVDISGDSKLEVVDLLSYYDCDGSGINYFINEGTIESPVWSDPGFLFNSYNSVSVSFADFDNDNDLDIISSTYMKQLFYIENIGTSDIPQMRYSFCGISMGPISVDKGENISFVDYDNDGDFDLTYSYPEFVFSDPEYYLAWRTMVNVGTPDIPIFSFDGQFTPSWMGIVHFYDMWTSDGDLNGDAYPEMACNRSQRYYINQSGAGYDLSHIANMGLNADGYNEYPELIDMNSDGLTDLLIRHQDSLTWLAFENVGSPEEPLWQRQNSWVSGFENLTIKKLRSARIDPDSKYDLVCIDDDSHLLGLINTSSGDNVSFTYVPEIFQNWQADLIEFYDCVDIDNDGDDDILFNNEGVINMIENKTTTDITDPEPMLPENTALLQNYPNPFNASTVISFTLDKPGEVMLTVYDILGREVETLIDGVLAAGEHSLTWTAGSDQASGMYFYKLETEQETCTRQMVYVK